MELQEEEEESFSLAASKGGCSSPGIAGAIIGSTTLGMTPVQGHGHLCPQFLKEARAQTGILGYFYAYLPSTHACTYRLPRGGTHCQELAIP